VRASSSGRLIRQKRAQWGGRGTGAVKATGSWEESLSVEGTSGCHEPSPFTRRWSRRPWRLPHAGRQRLERARCWWSAKALCDSAEEEEATGVSEARLQWAPWEEDSHALFRTRRVRRKGKGSACPSAVRRSVLGCRETPGSLVSRSEPKTPRGRHAVKAAESAGSARGTGTRNIVQVAEVGRTHRAPCPPGDRKICWWTQQGASQKEARSLA
jgi:hypothetical protein